LLSVKNALRELLWQSSKVKTEPVPASLTDTPFQAFSRPAKAYSSPNRGAIAMTAPDLQYPLNVVATLDDPPAII